MKKIVILILCPFSIVANELVIHEDSLLAPSKLGALKLLKTEEGFEVITLNDHRKVHNYDVV